MHQMPGHIHTDIIKGVIYSDLALPQHTILPLRNLHRWHFFIVQIELRRFSGSLSSALSRLFEDRFVLRWLNAFGV